MGRVGSNNRQKEFVKEYERLCARNNRHQVWSDFVYMAAAAISNAVDKRHAEHREEQYMAIVKKYTREELDVFPTLFALIVSGMEEYPDQDFLGELYMELNLGNDKNGQFFTPYDVCKCMAMLTTEADVLRARIERQGYITINDCACGAGATLIAAAMVLKDAFKDISFNYQQQALFIAQDIDYTTALMCYIQLSLLGCAGYVRVGNTLTDPMVGHVLFGDGSEKTWYTPMFFSDIWKTRRAVENMRSLLANASGVPVPILAEPSSTMDVTENRQEEPLQPSAEHTKPEPPPSEPIFTVSTKKKNVGQMMIDFGGLL